jgi:predicted N-acyltransferase
MSPRPEPISVRVLAALAEVAASDWDALVPPSARPFLTWGFLELLESSGSAAPEKGWTPRHLTLWRGKKLVAAAAGWVKTHSMGEFFYNDFRWPAVTPRFGVEYYPKYVVCAPFTPITSPKLLVHPDEDGPKLRRALAKAALELAKEEGFSSAAVLFASEEDLAALSAEGFAPGTGMQFQWENKGYRTLDDFLARFNAKRRHMVRTELAQPAKDGTTIRTLAGAELTEEVLGFAGRCYERTCDTHGFGGPHLTPRFFREVAARVPGGVEVVLAEEGGRPVGAAFNLRGERRLFGRHWGALADRRFLHFNVCYYHSVERCIALGLEGFEPGAGGEHKMARGFEPTLVHSAHAFVDERLHAGMSTYLAREAAAYREGVAAAREDGRAFRGGAGAQGSGA